MLTRDSFFGYQVYGVDFFKKLAACACWADCGLGKTTIGLTAFDDLRQQGKAKHLLAIAPLRVARKGWRDEAQNWEHLKHLTFASITGTVAERMRALQTPADVHTVNWDNLIWLFNQFVQNRKQIMRWPWDMVVADEAHRLKSQGSKRRACLVALRKLFPRFVELTGTPAPNMYDDLWGQVYLLDQGQRLGFTESAYLTRWFDPPPSYKQYGRWTLKPGAKEEIHAAIRDIVMVVRDPPDLPPVVINPVRVELTPVQMQQYKELAREFVMWGGSERIKAANTGVLQNKLLQLANGMVYAADWMTGERKSVHLHDAKLDALDELLDDLDGKKLILAYYFKHDLPRITARLEKYAGKRIRVLQSAQDEDDWNEGKIDWLLIHPDSAGEGVNLHKCEGAEDIIWFGQTANLGSWIQLNGRLFGGQRRVGKKGVVHCLLADGTVDDIYRELLTTKDATQDGLMAALETYTELL